MTSFYRRCDNPKPEHGGYYCSGEKVKTESCNTHACPGKTLFVKKIAINQKFIILYKSFQISQKNPRNKNLKCVLISGVNYSIEVSFMLCNFIDHSTVLRDDTFLH